MMTTTVLTKRGRAPSFAATLAAALTLALAAVAAVPAYASPTTYALVIHDNDQLVRYNFADWSPDATLGGGTGTVDTQDLGQGAYLFGASDGTMFAASGHTIRRYHADGTPWATAGKTGATFAVSDDFKNKSNYSSVNLGPDGDIYAVTINWGGNGIHRYDPLTAAREIISTDTSYGAAFGADYDGDGQSDLYTFVKNSSTNTITNLNIYSVAGDSAALLTTLVTPLTTDIRSMVLYGDDIIVATRDDHLHILDATDGSNVDVGLGPGVLDTTYTYNHTASVALGPDGNLYAAQSFGNLRVYDPDTGEYLGGVSNGGYHDYAVAIYTVPEPAGVALLALGALALLPRRRREGVRGS